MSIGHINLVVAVEPGGVRKPQGGRAARSETDSHNQAAYTLAEIAVLLVI